MAGRGRNTLYDRGALRELIASLCEEDRPLALTYAIFRRAVLDWINRVPEAVRYATRPFPPEEGDPCEGCKRSAPCSSEWPECGRYGIGFDSLGQELEVYWFSEMGALTREWLGAEDFLLGDIDVRSEAEGVGVYGVSPDDGPDPDIDVEVPLTARRRW